MKPVKGINPLHKESLYFLEESTYVCPLSFIPDPQIRTSVIPTT